MSEDKPAAGGPLRFMLRAFAYRNYRLFFGGQSVSLVGTWMQQVAMSWLVYRLTGSAFLLGVVGFAEPAVRVALSRMTAAGDVVRDDGRYRLSDRLLERQHYRLAMELANRGNDPAGRRQAESLLRQVDAACAGRGDACGVVAGLAVGRAAHLVVVLEPDQHHVGALANVEPFVPPGVHRQER